jgi:hypothetical protein
LQLRNVPGAVVAVLEMVPSLRAYGLQPLAQAAARVLQATGLHGGAAELCDRSFTTRAVKELAALTGRSLDTAIYT